MDLREWPPKGSVRHPWETARFHFFAKILLTTGLNLKPIMILDAGAGDGWFSSRIISLMHPHTIITCWDGEYNKEKIKIISATAATERIRYTSEKPVEKFDLLILLDVLEHVDDDAAFLSTIINDNLHDDSFALISVPAWPMLYSKHDEHLKHLRRYCPKKCKELLQKNGLKIIASGGLFHSLLLPRFLSIILNLILAPRNMVKDIGDWQYGHFLTGCIEKMLFMDNEVSLLFSKLKLDLPGLSWWALCKKQ
jgi:hypothetical protein